MAYKRRFKPRGPYRRKIMARSKAVPFRRRPRYYRKRIAKKSGLKLIRVKNDGINATYSSTNTGMTKFKYAMRKKYWIGTKNIWEKLIAYPMVVLAGTTAQQAYYAVPIFDYSNLQLMLTTVASTEIPINPTSVGNLQNTTRFYLNKAILEHTLTNNSNTPVIVDVYKFIAKRDTALTPQTCWFQGLDDETNQTAINYANTWGVSPLSSVKLSTFYKTTSITKMVIQPGQMHVHKTDYHICRPMNTEILCDNADTLFYRGITQFIMFVARGSGGITSTISSVENTAPVSLSVITRQVYDFKYIFDAQTNYTSALTGWDNTGARPLLYNQGDGTLTGKAGTTTNPPP